MESSKPPRIHTLNIWIATLAGIITIVGGVLSLKMNLSEGTVVFGELRGLVRDERLARPLRLATVEIADADGNIIGTLSTDDDGIYSQKGLKEGNYSLRVSAPFHASQERRVSVQKNSISTVDFNLAPEELPQVAAIPTVTLPVVQTYPPAPMYRGPVPDTSTRDMPLNAEPPYKMPSDENLNQRQPTSTELLVKAGAVLLEQMMTEKKRKRESTAKTVGSFVADQG